MDSDLRDSIDSNLKRHVSMTNWHKQLNDPIKMMEYIENTVISLSQIWQNISTNLDSIRVGTSKCEKTSFALYHEAYGLFDMINHMLDHEKQKLQLEKVLYLIDEVVLVFLQNCRIVLIDLLLYF